MNANHAPEGPDNDGVAPPSRALDLKSSIAVNMLEMVGVGPFITLPLIVSAMGGPQAMLGWVLGAIVAMCDGLVWAELGAAMPQAGGSYIYLREMFGPAGRWISFLYVWQFTLSGPLVFASGAIGLAQYASFLWPGLRHPLVHSSIPFVAGLQYTNSHYYKCTSHLKCPRWHAGDKAAGKLMSAL